MTRQLALWSLSYPIYYLAASWIVTLRVWRSQFARARSHEGAPAEQPAPSVH